MNEHVEDLIVTIALSIAMMLIAFGALCLVMKLMFDLG